MLRMSKSLALVFLTLAAPSKTPVAVRPTELGSDHPKQATSAKVKTHPPAKPLSHADDVNDASQASVDDDEHGVHGSSGHAAHADHGAEPTAKAMSLELIIMVTSVMSIFYLVNWQNEHIRQETWKVLSSTVSIFCSIMIFDSFRQVTQFEFDEPLDAHHDGYHPPPPPFQNYCNFARFIGLYILFQFILALVHKVTWALQAIGIMGGHVIGFSCIEAFGTLQQYEPFCTSPWRALGGAFLTLVVLLFLFIVMTEVRKHVNLTDGTTKTWNKQVANSEDDALALVLGHLICQCVKFAIVGQLSPVHGAPKGKSEKEVLSLFWASMGFAVLTYVGTRCREYAISQTGSKTKRRVIEIIQGICSMSCGWCLLYWGQWFFWSSTDGAGLGTGDKMTARLFMGVAFGITGVFCIFLMESARGFRYLEEDALQTLVTTVGLLVGLSWESCFSCAVQGLSTGTDVYGIPMRIMGAAIDAGIAFVVAPAWGMYILPMAMQAEEESSASDIGQVPQQEEPLLKDRKQLPQEGQEHPKEEEQLPPVVDLPQDGAPLPKGAVTTGN